MVIDFYTPDFFELNNFSAHAVEFEGELYPTAEHAYQTTKCTDSTGKQAIRTARSPQAAKHLANIAYKSARDPDWDTGNGAKKLRAMEQILRAKLAQHTDVVAALAKSGQHTLVEGSPTDKFWGTDADGTGQNQLGLLWMKLRAGRQTKKP